MPRIPQILICDDDRLMQDTFKLALKGLGQCRSAYNAEEALAIVKNHPIDLVLLDVQMRTKDEGLRAIPQLKAADPDVSIVMLSGVTDYTVVREAMRAGADDYVAKAGDPSELTHVVSRVLSSRSLAIQVEQKESEVRGHQRKHVLVGKSPAVQQLLKVIDKIRQSPANVVITGETGTGKEVVARMLRGTLPNGTLAPFQSIDSATIQSTTAESTLFGHEAGAFTGAQKTTKGIFEEANGGIVYFDEIANMPLSIQTKLLRVLQEKEVTRLGSTKVIPLSFRVVCATNRDLDGMVKDGQFQADLLQRIAVLPVQIPPLRERAEDVPLLLEHFAATLAPTRPIVFTEDALATLTQYSWPGNVRELGNLVAYVLTMADGDEVDLSDLPQKFRDRAFQANGAPSPVATEGSFYDRVAAYEKNLLAAAYEKGAANVSKLALALGMDRSHLHSKLKEHGIHQVRPSAQRSPTER